MRWRKLGLLYMPDGKQWWARSHAMAASPLWISEDVLRLYVSHVDENTVGRVGYIDVGAADPTRVIAKAENPILDVGEPGAFDDNGVVCTCVVPVEGQLRMYYGGFQLQTKIPYTMFSGMAVSETIDGPFHRIARGPILDRVEGEFFFRTAPFVLQENGRWRMWYIGGDSWIKAEKKTFPSYSMRYVESDDGIFWSARSVECLALNRPDEIGLGRPFVVRDGALYHMWYSIRKISGYRVGYATSLDGLQWTRRDDEAGIDRSDSGWDSEMICYTAIVPVKDNWLMFYNGNGYGQSGVGVAQLDAD